MITDLADFNLGFNSDSNFDFPYETELKFKSEIINVLEKDRKNLAAQNLLYFFREFRTILLQNSVIIRF
jgi:hypothetical protein